METIGNKIKDLRFELIDELSKLTCYDFNEKLILYFNHHDVFIRWEMGSINHGTIYFKPHSDLDVDCGSLSLNSMSTDNLIELSEYLNNHNNFDHKLLDAIKYVQESYCDRHLSTPYMLMGDIVKLIKILTDIDVDYKLLTKYSK